MPPLAVAGFSAFLVSVLPYICGHESAAILGVLFLAAFVGVQFTKKDSFSYRRMLLFALAGATAAMARYAWVSMTQLQPALAYEGGNWRVEGQITDILSQNGSVRYTVRGHLPDAAFDDTVEMQLWATSDLAAGELGNTIDATVYFYESTADSSWKQAVRASNGVLLRGRITACDFRESDRLYLETIFSRLRYRMARTVAYAIPDKRGALISAILCGDRSGLEAELEWDIRCSGLSHLLAISGFHLSVVVSILRMFVHGKSPAVRSTICFVGIVVYTLLTGAPYSVIRAAVMWSLMLLAEATFRQYYGVNALGAAMLLLTLMQPLSAASLSLWYSALATLAILLLGERMTDFFAEKLGVLTISKLAPEWKKRRRKVLLVLLRSISASLAACMAVMPVSWITGNAVSVVSPISTLLSSFLLTPMVFGGFLLNALSWVPVLSDIIAAVVGIFSGMFVLVIEFFGNLPFAVIPKGIVWIAFWLVSLIPMAAVCVWYREEHGILCAGVLWSVISFSLSLLGYQILTRDLTRIVIPAETGCAIVSKGHTHFLAGELMSEAEGEAAAQTLQDYGIRQLELAVLGEWSGTALEALCREVEITALCVADASDREMLRYADTCYPLEPAGFSMGEMFSLELTELPKHTGYAISISADGAGMLIFSSEYAIINLDVYKLHDLVLLPEARAEEIDHLPADYNVVTSCTGEYNLYHAPRSAVMVDARNEDAVFYVRDGSVKLVS